MSDDGGVWGRLRILTGFLTACVALGGLYTQCSKDDAPKAVVDRTTPVSSPQYTPRPPEPVSVPAPIQATPMYATICQTQVVACPMASPLPINSYCICYAASGLPIADGIAR